MPSLNDQNLFLTFLPEPGEALINFFRHIEKEGKPAKSVKLELSSIEAPSARLAACLYQIEKTGTADVEFRVESIQTPDPRIPHHPVAFTLWEYSGMEPRTAFPHPPETVSRRVGEIAATTYSRDDWADQGRRAARELGPNSADDLLAVMVHPPVRRDPFVAWVWLQRAQIASAFVLGAIDSGWEDSIRKRCLLSLARGPMDWTVGAALLPLSYIAEKEPEYADNIGELYYELLISIPKSGFIPFEFVLLWCISRSLSLKLISDSLRKILAAPFLARLKPPPK
jgi:hypothetical protein